MTWTCGRVGRMHGRALVHGRVCVCARACALARVRARGSALVCATEGAEAEKGETRRQVREEKMGGGKQRLREGRGQVSGREPEWPTKRQRDCVSVCKSMQTCMQGRDEQAE
eukprot:1307261-Pleurochrysis_carterae.AAC.1